MSRLMSFDVECVANGMGHNDRSVARVAVVDGSTERTLLDVCIHQESEVVSYLTPITGLTEDHFDPDIAGNKLVTFDEMLAKVHKLLGPEVLLVGQGIQSDIDWLGLEEGVHFAEARDIAEDFKAWNPRYRQMNYFSLAATAQILLGLDMSGSHDPDQDARAALQLYKKYVAGPRSEKLMENAKNTMIRARKPQSVAKQLNYQCDGVCMAKFYRAKCICGQGSAA